MKKIFSILLVGTAVFATAQVKLAAKVNLLFPTASSSWKDVSAAAINAYDKSGKNNTGFNVGLSAKIDLPTSLFLMPEIYYTSFKTEFTEPNSNTELAAKSNRIDVPVLLGYNILGEMLGIYLGPVASYNLAAENTYKDFKENATSNFTVGYQIGAQAQISKLIITARYEGALSKDQRTYTAIVVGNPAKTINYDSRPSFLILGLGYQF